MLKCEQIPSRASFPPEKIKVLQPIVEKWSSWTALPKARNLIKRGQSSYISHPIYNRLLFQRISRLSSAPNKSNHLPTITRSTIMVAQFGTAFLALASLNLLSLAFQLFWCHPSASTRNIFHPIFAACPDDGFQSLSDYNQCSLAKKFSFVISMLIFPFTLLLLTLYLQQCIARRRQKKEARRELSRSNARDFEGRQRPGSTTAEPDLERAGDIELSDWETIRAPAPVYALRPGAGQSGIAPPSGLTISVRSYSIASLPPYQSTESLSRYWSL